MNPHMIAFALLIARGGRVRGPTRALSVRAAGVVPTTTVGDVGLSSEAWVVFSEAALREAAAAEEEEANDSRAPRAAASRALGDGGAEMAGGDDPEQRWASLTVVHLKERLRERGLPVSGKKSVLVERLARADGAVAREVDDDAAAAATPTTTNEASARGRPPQRRWREQVGSARTDDHARRGRRIEGSLPPFDARNQRPAVAAHARSPQVAGIVAMRTPRTAPVDWSGAGAARAHDGGGYTRAVFVRGGRHARSPLDSLVSRDRARRALPQWRRLHSLVSATGARDDRRSRRPTLAARGARQTSRRVSRCPRSL